ncbi:MAG: hypothetical protein JSV57_01155, partial [Candidatus Bathyarchaeota archaeon]
IKMGCAPLMPINARARVKYDLGREILKWSAIITMTIDHAGAVLYQEHLLFRYIGRLSFPLFAYLLILGLETTRSVKNYFTRLFLFALISQVPFYLAMGVKPWEYLNIFFTLSSGVLFIELHKRGNFLLFLPLVAAEVLHFDYGIYGILTMGCFYYLRRNRTLGIILFLGLNLLYLAVSSSSILALLALPPILLHNSGRFHLETIGEKVDYSRWKKYFFYVYYPLHLIALFSIKAGL